MSEADPFITASSKPDIFEDNDLPIDLPADNDVLDQQDPSESFLSRHGWTIFKVIGISILLAPIILPFLFGAPHIALGFMIFYAILAIPMMMLALLAFG